MQLFDRKSYKSLYNQRIVRYALGGGIAAAVDLVFLYIFTEYGHIYYLYSQILSFIISFFVGFLFQKYITFQQAGGNVVDQGGRFLAYQLIGIGINLLLMRYLVEHMGIHYLVASVIAKGVVFLWNFFMNHFFNFK